MIGGHSPNVDVEELARRFGSALRLASIFQDHPNWERKPRRLKLERSCDADHLSPRHWKGELRASSCDLNECWKKGIQLAEISLAKFGYSINFGQHFGDWQTRRVDLLRPKGGKYPGISAEVERSLTDSTDTENATTSATESTIESEHDFSFQSYDGAATYRQEVLDAEANSREAHSIWLTIEGKLVHKKTALRLFMDPTFDIDYKKSHDRLLRV
ncbi:hypothetical protein CPB83DRAFT_776856, partial [Crepidotus variabilis]